MGRIASALVVAALVVSAGCGAGDARRSALYPDVRSKDTTGPQPTGAAHTGSAGRPDASTTTVDDPGGDHSGATDSDPGADPGSDASTPTSTFTVRTERFVDPSRPTGSTPGRQLPTDIYLPDGKPTPHPVIVLAHGYGGDAQKFSKLLGSWASAGFVAVAPTFPLTSDIIPVSQRNAGDIANQPADVEYVLDQVLAMGRDGQPLAGELDDAHIGVAGLSLGGGTIYPLVYDSCCRDPRFTAALAMSSVGLPDFAGGTWDFTRRFPIMVFAGTADTTVPYATQQVTEAKLAGPKWFVTLEGGMHSPPYEDFPDPHDEVVTRTTVDFWKATLQGDIGAKDRLTADGTADGLAHVDVTG